MRGPFPPRAVAAAVLVVACGEGSSSRAAADSAGTDHSAIATAAGSKAAGVSSPCPATGLWAVCSAEQRIRRAGLVAKRLEGDTPQRAAFTVKPVVYALGRDSRLELFIYPSAAALASDIEKMDTIKVAPRGNSERWGAPPTLIKSGNLAGVLLSHDAREADRVYLALTAGAPAAARGESARRNELPSSR